MVSVEEKNTMINGTQFFTLQIFNFSLFYLSSHCFDQTMVSVEEKNAMISGTRLFTLPPLCLSDLLWLKGEPIHIQQKGFVQSHILTWKIQIFQKKMKILNVDQNQNLKECLFVDTQ